MPLGSDSASYGPDPFVCRAWNCRQRPWVRFNGLDPTTYGADPFICLRGWGVKSPSSHPSESYFNGSDQGSYKPDPSNAPVVRFNAPDPSDVCGVKSSSELTDRIRHRTARIHSLVSRVKSPSDTMCGPPDRESWQLASLSEAYFNQKAQSRPLEAGATQWHFRESGAYQWQACPQL